MAGCRLPAPAISLYRDGDPGLRCRHRRYGMFDVNRLSSADRSARSVALLGSGVDAMVPWCAWHQLITRVMGDRSNRPGPILVTIELNQAAPAGSGCRRLRIPHLRTSPSSQSLEWLAKLAVFRRLAASTKSQVFVGAEMSLSSSKGEH